MNINFNRPPRSPKGILAQLFTVVVGAILLGAAFMFSLVFFAVLAIAGLIFWLYFWWKTRAVRAQLRKQMQGKLAELLAEEGRRQTHEDLPL